MMHHEPILAVHKEEDVLENVEDGNPLTLAQPATIYEIAIVKFRRQVQHVATESVAKVFSATRRVGAVISHALGGVVTWSSEFVLGIGPDCGRIDSPFAWDFALDADPSLRPARANQLQNWPPHR